MVRLVRILTSILVLAVCAGVGVAESVTFWYWHPVEVWQGGYEPLVKAFEAETGITVDPVYVGWADMQDRLVVAIAGGAVPDVAMVSSRYADTLATRGAFLDLTPRVQRDPTFNDFFPAVMQLWKTWDSKQYGIGGDIDIPALFYNKEMFDEAGIPYPTDIDWDDWFQITRSLTRDIDGDGQFDEYGLSTWWYVWITMVWANGGDIINATRTDIALDTPEAREAITFYKSFVDQGFLPEIADAQRLGSEHPAALFHSGRIAMAPAGAWVPEIYIYNANTGRYNFDFDVAHLPRSYNGGRATPIEGGALVIPVGAQNPDGAWAFIQHMSSVEALRATGMDGFPSRISVAREAFSQPGREPENAQRLVEVVEYARPFPQGIDWWGGVYTAIMGELNTYITGIESLNAALENASVQVRPLLEEARAD